MAVDMILGLRGILRGKIGKTNKIGKPIITHSVWF